ncbi:diaminopimelate decarboxylase [Streptoalloteichus tenebrarius]|uniref:Diaminopimelate decarboxylase n=1 Tax=Streptoalloteichus tenebrarius (strain ATCC 17920 / DSM 40477 / JCM 4838 / CBS 697.72 / NBRC 16177 / NCIMB 11028 / NRRL B-12390 / A12253. 1 / ISP 5477) TaxID=1933 RepID=A0ABT1HXN4_STRSD|nr:diaminopimelate decarboxylase [Streptoalloteichus tenebrarius]MCP2260279.1 diaminopimelate decarboxylase [Streptoalloteichus tenebrarius]BFF03029.1 diaminopimelate decarboxylase [Streptoalloteichus tenebrarius]
MRAHPAGPRHADVLAPANTAGPRPSTSDELNRLHERVWPRNARRDDDGVTRIAGVDVRDLAERYGTPLFVVDEADFRSRCAEHAEAFGDPALVHYASKAFLSTAIARWVAEEGLSLDVCSGGELAVALRAEFPPERITFHGNNKSVEELAAAVDAGVGTIVLDSFFEIARLDQVARERDVRQAVLIRVTVGVEAHTHEFIATAHEDQKFGFSLASGDAAEAVRRVLRAPGLNLVGLHSHIGSQIFDADGFEVAARRVVSLLADIRDEHGADAVEQLSTVDLGGGLGIAYTPDDDPPPPAALAEQLRTIVRRECERVGLPVPRVAVEPGRAIVGPGTVTLYEVGTVKEVTVGGGARRRYVSVDGGMSDNVRTALYDAVYDCRLVSRAVADGVEPSLSRVVGKHCESGDVVVRDTWLPADIAPGDLLAVAATGAYCYSMSSRYNLLPRPAVVAVADGKSRLLVRRETVEDLLRLEVLEP